MIFEKRPDGRMKRIEYRGKYLRVSRTGGVALRTQAAAYAETCGIEAEATAASFNQ